MRLLSILLDWDYSNFDNLKMIVKKIFGEYKLSNCKCHKSLLEYLTMGIQYSDIKNIERFFKRQYNWESRFAE